MKATTFNYISGTGTTVLTTSKQFTTKATSTKNAAKTMRDSVQALIEAGLAHYNDHGDTVYLTKAMDCCIGTSALPSKLIKTYIQNHANVSYVKTGGVLVFQKVKPKTKGDKVAVEVEMPTITWSQFNAKVDTPKADYDVVTRLKNFIKGIEKAVEDGKVADGQSIIAQGATDDLKALLKSIGKGEYKETANDTVETVDQVGT